MEASAVRFGQQVQIVPTDHFYTFVEGWTGHVTGWQSGYVEVTCEREDGPKVFLIPSDQLREIGPA